MNSISQERTVRRLKGVAELPVSLRNALQQVEIADQPFLLLLHDSPMFDDGAKDHPPAILGVTAKEWVHAIEGPKGEVGPVVRHEIGATLLVELSIISLNGHLRIDYVKNGQPFAHGIQFFSAAENEYCEAAKAIVAAIPALSPRNDPAISDHGCAPKDFNARFGAPVTRLLPENEQVCAAMSWNAAIVGQDKWFKRELAPAGGLAVSDRSIVVICDPKISPKLHHHLPTKQGYVATLIPRSRLIGCGVTKADLLAQIDLQVGVHGARTTCRFGLPIAEQARAADILRDIPAAQTLSADGRP